jgi:ribosomal protein S7
LYHFQRIKKNMANEVTKPGKGGLDSHNKSTSENVNGSSLLGSITQLATKGSVTQSAAKEGSHLLKGVSGDTSASSRASHGDTRSASVAAATESPNGGPLVQQAYALKGEDKVRLYSEVVLNQFMHRLIMDGKASKARSILRKSLVLFANTPVFADWAYSSGVKSMDLPEEVESSEELEELEGEPSKGPTRDFTSGNTAAFTSVFGPFPVPSAPSTRHLDFLTSKQDRCRWSKVSVGNFYPHPIVWKALLVVLDKVKPIVEPKTVKRAGRKLCVPSEIPSSRQLSVAIRWIVQSARKRPGSSMVGSLTRELEDILAGSMDSGSLKRRDQWHRLAQSNRANVGMGPN